jgi:hypothetical protein
MNQSFHDRWMAASRAENTARREQASALLSGTALLMFFALIFVGMAIIDKPGVTQ